jgi:hypothetical protein
MGPPTEQLIRDYLNRLSVAARGQLGPDDRRALVNRTHDFIERKTGLTGPPTAVEVGRLLSGLGDPAKLVSQERQRLATLRGEELKPASRSRLARVLRGDPGRVRGASWHWPAQEGSRADLQLTLLDAGAPDPADRVRANGTSGGGQPAGPAAADTEGTAALVPAQSADLERPGGTRGQGQRWPAGVAAAERNGATPPDAESRTTAVPAVRPAETALVTWRLATPAGSAPARAALILARLADWSRRHKLEAVAIVLLGIGGAIFPPVWLLGAAVTLASRLWDYRDKWLGLAFPVLVSVIGTAAGIAAAGSEGTLGHHIHDGWVFADIISRVAALLGASYLAWRSAHGRRPPATPPWNKPHKVA